MSPGGLVSKNENCEDYLKRRIRISTTAFIKLCKIWKAKGISKTIKVSIYKCLADTAVLVGKLKIRKTDEFKISPAEMNWQRGMLTVSRL